MSKNSGGKKSKIGRNKKSPSMIAYVAQGRLAKNKRRRIEKEAKRQAACKAKRATSGGAA